MNLFLLSADNSDEMNKLAEELSQHKFNKFEEDEEFILMKKRRYGNILIHVVCLIVALQFLQFVIFINVIYFAYSYLWASPNVLITTEKVDDDGNKLEFNTVDEILKKANSLL